MLRYRLTKRFEKQYNKLDKQSQRAIDKAIHQFFTNPRPNSLRTKKIKGCYGIFELSGTMDIRVTYHFERPNTVVFRNCRHHDDALRNP